MAIKITRKTPQKHHPKTPKGSGNRTTGKKVRSKKKT